MASVKSRNAGDQLFEAHEIALEAYGAETAAERRRLARKALKISDLCADAHIVLALEEQPESDERLSRLETALRAGEAAIGSRTFRESAGEFWLVFETRPYMRALFQIAEEHWHRGERDRAIQCLRELLDLNPNDNQGARYPLVSRLLETGDSQDALEILERYPGEHSAFMRWSAVLVCFLQSGGGEAADKALGQAVACNPHVGQLLLDRRRLARTQPTMYSPGQLSEAQCYLADGLAAWDAHPTALKWVKSRLREGVEPVTPEETVWEDDMDENDPELDPADLADMDMSQMSALARMVSNPIFQRSVKAVGLKDDEPGPDFSDRLALAVLGEVTFGQTWRKRLAKALEIKPATLEKWLAGTAPMDPDWLERLSPHLDRVRDELENRLALLMAFAGDDEDDEYDELDPGMIS